MTGDDRKLALMIGAALVLALAAAVWLVTGDDGDGTGALTGRTDGRVAADVAEAVGARREGVNPVGAAGDGTDEDAARLDERASQEGPRPDLEVVLTWRGGGPVVGRAVLVRGRGVQGSAMRDVTNESGVARFFGVGDDSVDVQVPPSTQEQVMIERPGRTEVVRIELDDTKRIAGRVVTRDDVPVPDAFILVSTIHDDDPVVVARADAAGRFEVGGVAGEPWFFARVDGRAESPMVLATPDTEAVLIVGGDESPVAFVVRDVDGRPAAGALVVLVEHPDVAFSRQTPRPRHAPRFGITDKTGRVTFGGLGAGEFAWCVDHVGAAPFLGEVSLDRERPASVDVRFMPGVMLIGTVRDGDGSAIAGAAVDWAWRPYPRVRRETYTDSDGRFRLEDLPVGRHVVEARYGNLGVLVDVAGTAGEHVTRSVVIPGRVRLLGRCIDVRGDGVPQLFVVAQSGHQFHQQGQSARTDASGAFDIDVVKGRCRVLVHDRLGNVVVEASWQPGDGELRIVVPDEKTYTGSIQGRVLRRGGAPATGWLGIRRLGGPLADRLLQRGGEFAFHDLEPGIWEVVYQGSESRRVVLARVTLDEHQQLVLDPFIVGEGTGRIVLSVSGASEDELDAITVALLVPGHQVPRSQERSDDGFVFDALHAGTYRIRMGGAMAARLIDVDVVAGETARVPLTYDGGTVCRFRREAGNALLSMSGLAHVFVPADEDGEIAVFTWNSGYDDVGPLRLEAGSYELRLWLQNGIRKTFPFTVPEGVDAVTIAIPGD